jgi:hypothetical protein
MARDIERVELLFRRQVAIESARAPRRPVTYRLDAVSPLGGGWNIDAIDRNPTPVQRAGRGRPRQQLIPSAGFFNASRIPTTAATWLFLVGQASRRKFEKLISALINVQASKRSFRPIFILDGSEHLELLRHYGFSFEVLCPEEYMRVGKSEQVELFKAKWGATLCLDLDHLQSSKLGGGYAAGIGALPQ